MSISPQKQGGRFEPNYFYQFRLILIGDSTVGKSSLLRQFTDGHFIQTSDPTVGVDFHVRILQLNGRFIYIVLCYKFNSIEKKPESNT